MTRRATPSRAASCGFLRYSAAHGRHRHHGRELLGEERRELILRWLAAEGKVRASDLALRLRVSLDTVRRDLQELSDAGPAAPRPRRRRCRRVRPGPTRSSSACPTTSPRRPRSPRPRSSLIRPGEVIAISGGTTTLEFARRLPDDLDATVIATNPHIAAALADHPRLTVDLIGGRLHPAARTVTGPEAVDALASRAPRRVRAQRLFAAPAGGDDAAPSRGGAGRSRDGRAPAGLLSVTTASKLGSAGPYPVAAIERIDTLVSDAPDADVQATASSVEVVRPWLARRSRRAPPSPRSAARRPDLRRMGGAPRCDARSRRALGRQAGDRARLPRRRLDPRHADGRGRARRARQPPSDARGLRAHVPGERPHRAGPQAARAVACSPSSTAPRWARST